jgi:hypothetical protein
MKTAKTTQQTAKSSQAKTADSGLYRMSRVYRPTRPGYAFRCISSRYCGPNR